MIVWLAFYSRSGNALLRTVLKIGDNSIVLAGYVMIKDVPVGSIVSGVPAKVIGMREHPNKIRHLGNIYFCPGTSKIIEDQN